LTRPTAISKKAAKRNVFIGIKFSPKLALSFVAEALY